MNESMFQNKNVSIVKPSIHFESVVSSVACFSGGHRRIYNRHSQRLDSHLRKLCKSIVCLPPRTDWTLEWHKIRHQWNSRVGIFIGRANIKPCSRICCHLLDVSETYCHTTARTLGSTMVPRWNVSNWSRTF